MTNRITPPENVSTWLIKYTGNFGTYLSIKDQLHRNGRLTQGQIDCIEKAIKRESQPRQPQEKIFSYKAGDTIRIKNWFAKILSEEFELGVTKEGKPILYKNLLIMEVLNESAKAVEVVLRLQPGISTRCHVCNQKIGEGKSEGSQISAACGIGPVCAEKLGLRRPKLSEIQKTLDDLKEFADSKGSLTRWIPKGQIEEHITSDNYTDDEVPF